MTKRDDIIERNRRKSFYAVMYGKEPRNLEPVPELKPRKERAPSMEPTEHAEQKGVIEWWTKQYKFYGLPKFALYSVPNAQMLYKFARNPNAFMQYLKSEGLRNGIPDLQLDAARQGYHGLRLEMKRRTGGVVSPEQHEVHNYLRNAGYWVEVPRSAEMAIQCIKTYLGEV
jgi:hypothetical protein